MPQPATARFPRPHRMVRFDPARPDFAPYGFTCVRWAPTPMGRPDRHNEIEMNFLGSGWVTYLLGGRKVRIEAGRLSTFWAAIPHQILEYGDETDYFVATLPLAWFLHCKFPSSLVQSLLQGRMVSESNAGHARSDERLFASWERDLRGEEAGATKAALLELEARLLRLGLSAHILQPSPTATPKRRGAVGEAGLRKVEQMACFIAQNYTERLTVGVIAGGVSLHPNYAMNLFHRSFGTTLVDYITQHRVSHAQRLLATSDQKVIDIAVSSGFGSISRFNEAFRRTCGCSPREYRHRHALEP